VPASPDRLPQALAYCRLCPAFAEQILFLREGKKDLVFPRQGLLIRDFFKKAPFNKSLLKASAFVSLCFWFCQKQKRNLF
jgi:hypothetical protein